MATEVIEKARGIFAGLAPQQIQFVKHVVEDGMGATQAMKAMGLNPKSSFNTYVSNRKIQAALLKYREDYARSAGIKKADVINGMMEAINMGKSMSDPTAMVSGWREIGKLCGFYEPVRKELTISVQGQQNLTRLQSMSDEDLLALVEQGEDVIEGDFSAVAEDEELGAESLDEAGGEEAELDGAESLDEAGMVEDE